MPITHAVVPVAGLGTRLLPATKSQPKEMLPVGKRPVVQYVVEELERNGFNRSSSLPAPTNTRSRIISTWTQSSSGYLRETGKEELLEELEFERADVHFFYTRQRMQLGLGDAVLYAEQFAGHKPFAVALGDSILGTSCSKAILFPVWPKCLPGENLCRCRCIRGSSSR